MEEQKNRPHRDKKEKKKPTSGQNPKAFAYSTPGKLAKQAARAHDVREKRLHVPLVDRLPEEAPPFICAVVGPPGVGKTTLIKSLVKRYTKYNLSSPTGPMTVITSKRRRITFIECPADSLASMVDISKVADMVLLMIDGNYGFEMETMEFLNVLGASGMPGNVFGILTHLDLFKKPQTLREAKKRLKHRFWSELYQGAKLFYLSGVINGRYPDREIHNLSRFISVMKNPRPVIWRNSHPYCLADRFLDCTPPTAIEQNPKCDRSVALYGYLRGTNFPAEGARVHVPGVGDHTVYHIEALPDPCPTPFMSQAIAKATGKTQRKRLGEKQKVLYAPMSDVGGVLVDKDAVYIDVKSSTFDQDNDQERGLGEQMVVDLQGNRRLLGESKDGVRLFAGGTTLADDTEEKDSGRKVGRRPRVIKGQEEAEHDVEDEGYSTGGDASQDDDGENYIDASNVSEDKLGRAYRDHDSVPKRPPDHQDLAFADSDSDLGSLSDVSEQDLEEAPNDYDDEVDGLVDDEFGDGDDLGQARWKENLRETARKRHGGRKPYQAADLARMLYDENLTPDQVVRHWQGRDDIASEENEDDEEENFFKRTARDSEDDLYDAQTLPEYDYQKLAEKWSKQENIDDLMQRFTKVSLSKDAKSTDGIGSDDSEADESDEGDGEFEDLEAKGDHIATRNQVKPPEVDIDAEREENARRKEELKLRFEEEDREGFLNDKAKARAEAGADGEFGEDDWYDAQKAKIQKQLDINRAEFETMDENSRRRTEGYKAGTYCRIVLENVPYEFVVNFDSRFPVIVGGLSPTEERFGYVQVRIKRHRWHKKILKTNDPLIFSLGWRRFQSTPLYSISDSRTRNRMLKYTPEHMHCFGTFYGPLVAPNTGFCCMQTLSSKTPGFRIAATGVVLNVDESVEIVKKLKLTGYPYKIFRNTAFIRDMFSSALEIAKFEGASIKTVSGIRGQIKKALSKPDGHFRATFEDKILMSDIVFLRAWFPVKPHRFYNPVTNLLDVAQAPIDGQNSITGTDGAGWQGMRLTGEVRAAADIPTPKARDSAYRPIQRETRHFNSLRVPRQLAADLPFKSQIAQMKPQKRPTYLQSRAVVVGGEEKKARALMHMVNTLRRAKDEKRAKKKEEQRQVYKKKVAENEEKRETREKRERDEYWQKEGRKRKGQEVAGAGGGGKRRRG